MSNSPNSHSLPRPGLFVTPPPDPQPLHAVSHLPPDVALETRMAPAAAASRAPFSQPQRRPGGREGERGVVTGRFCPRSVTWHGLKIFIRCLPPTLFI
jgi:hypothetical protein